jgi:hypothetical protein
MHRPHELGRRRCAAPAVGCEVLTLHLRFDQRVSRCKRGRDSVSAVANEERIVVTNEANRRRLTAALEPRAVALDGRLTDTAGSPAADANVRERDPVGCCE